MVVTPLHYPVAYAVYRLSRRRLSLLGLVVGSMVPDLEVPILYALYGPLRDRLVLHSILGGAFIVPAIGLALFPIIELTIKRVLKVEAVSVRLSTYSLPTHRGNGSRNLRFHATRVQPSALASDVIIYQRPSTVWKLAPILSHTSLALL